MRLTKLLAAGSLLALATPVYAADEGKASPEEAATAVAPAADQAATEAKPEKKKDEGGFQLKPRWRAQYDNGKVSVPDNVNAPGMGWNDMIRRAYVGVDAKFGGGFSSRVELELAGEDPEFTDAYIAYDTKNLNVTVGQQKFFQSLDDMTSDLNTSFAERAAFTQAFGFTRRLGLSASVKKDDLLFQAGVSTEPLIGLNDVKDNSIGVDGRVVWAPKMGKTQLHLGASAHWRDRNDLVSETVRYRARPFVRTTDTRFVSTPRLIVEKELGYGVEAGAVMGRFHATGEAYWVRPDVPAAENPNLWGGYAEAGVFLTNDSRPYKGGTWGTIKPKHAFGSGGIGAVQLNARYDYLDLNSAGITGGQQKSLMGSLVWTPIENIRFSGNYARLKFNDAVIAATNGDRDYSADAFLFRFQIHY